MFAGDGGGKPLNNLLINFHFQHTKRSKPAAASSAESQECPLSGSYTLTGPLGPPYMMSRHKRNHINGSKQHHHSAAHNTPTRHDVLSFRNTDMLEHSLHPHDRLNSQRHRRDLSKCISTHKQRRRLSIGCSRDDIVEVHPQCSEAGDEGTEIWFFFSFARRRLDDDFSGGVRKGNFRGSLLVRDEREM